MIKRTWTYHGTKLLGLATTIVSSALAANAAIPDGQEKLIAPGQMKWFLFANLFLGAMTVKRGFSNSKAQAPGQPQ